MSSKRRSKLKKSNTEHITLTSNAMHTVAEVNVYQEELLSRLNEFGITGSYTAWYLTTTYGKQADLILDKINFFVNKDAHERLIRAELWYCVYYEMANSLVDFFVRRTGRLYFNIASISKYRKVVLEDFINYLDWDSARVEKENKILDILLEDATHYYDKEL